MTDLNVFKPGDTVSHCRRVGFGTVHTVSIHPITGRPAKVIVHFATDYGAQPVVCWPDDLTPRPSAILPPPVRPRLTVAGAA